MPNNDRNVKSLKQMYSGQKIKVICDAVVFEIDELQNTFAVTIDDYENGKNELYWYFPDVKDNIIIVDKKESKEKIKERIEEIKRELAELESLEIEENNKILDKSWVDQREQMFNAWEINHAAKKYSGGQ